MLKGRGHMDLQRVNLFLTSSTNFHDFKLMGSHWNKISISRYISLSFLAAIPNSPLELQTYTSSQFPSKHRIPCLLGFIFLWLVLWRVRSHGFMHYQVDMFFHFEFFCLFFSISFFKNYYQNYQDWLHDFPMSYTIRD